MRFGALPPSAFIVSGASTGAARFFAVAAGGEVGVGLFALAPVPSFGFHEGTSTALYMGGECIRSRIAPIMLVLTESPIDLAFN